MSLHNALAFLYPDAGSSDWVIGDEGVGEYIAGWNLDAPPPAWPEVCEIIASGATLDQALRRMFPDAAEDAWAIGRYRGEFIAAWNRPDSMPTPDAIARIQDEAEAAAAKIARIEAIEGAAAGKFRSNGFAGVDPIAIILGAFGLCNKRQSGVPLTPEEQLQLTTLEFIDTERKDIYAAADRAIGAVMAAESIDAVNAVDIEWPKWRGQR